jgi:hypothetical protein
MKGLSFFWTGWLIVAASAPAAWAGLPGTGHRPFSLRDTAVSAKEPHFRSVLDARKQPQQLERAKILYLVHQLRLSNRRFERNRAVYAGSRAASHMLMKYNAVKNRIHSAQEFIDRIATRSSSSGQPYYILDERGNKYPSREVLTEELHRLESRLARIS